MMGRGWAVQAWSFSGDEPVVTQDMASILAFQQHPVLT
jgi:hypothetical protein